MDELISWWLGGCYDRGEAERGLGYLVKRLGTVCGRRIGTNERTGPRRLAKLLTEAMERRERFDGTVKQDLPSRRLIGEKVARDVC
jgi:hypothetical protein